MKFYRFGYVVCATAFALVSCNGTPLHVANPANANASPAATSSSSPLNQKKSNEKPRYYLALDKPEIEQAIESSDLVTAKFVQVEITEVTNPQNRPARFEVFYQPKEGERVLLGSFSLYPPNNPGHFIVPTQGKVKPEGKIILSLAKPEDAVAGDVVRVGVRKLKFVNDVDH